MSSDVTPMMRQYLEIKEKHKDSILFFRLGDFYEMFFDDAIEATRILHITLTSRSSTKGGKVPMCGVPHHAADNYIARLIKHGKKVAICEQVEEPSPGKKIVKREVLKIITPGTFMADGILDDAVNNYILSIKPGGENYGLAYADISTGEFRVTELGNKEELFSELYKISPSECLIPESFSDDKAFGELKDINMGAITVNEDWMFDHALSEKEIKSHFNVHSLEGFGCHEMALAVGSAGALLKYLKNTQKTDLDNLGAISAYRASQYMSMDRNSHRHLELVQNQEDLSTRGTLFGILDRTKTPMGKRKLKRWILNPLVDVDEVKKRLEAVDYFFRENTCRKNTREILSNVYDIERLSNKVSMGSANARDVVALGVSLKNVTGITGHFKGVIPQELEKILPSEEKYASMIKTIEGSLVDTPPVTVKEGGIIKDGYDGEVDELRYIVNNGKDWLTALQEREIRRTGINSLKVGFNKVFGYYIEVTKANLSMVPDDYTRKQTLTNAERFITQELKEQESRIIGSEERIKNLEYEVFCRIRDGIAKEIDSLKNTADNIAVIDVLSDLAEVAVTSGYIKPVVNNGSIISIKEGRHPVLEKILKDKEFVPNDVEIDRENNRIFIITGSNMAGKSTFIRQVAIITVMAQMGSFIPASSAEIGIVDSIFTRVGASDRLYQGMSTFMVEMLETSNILNNATNRSLIILDEVGRGTSTFDGVSIAWAVVEFIHHNLPGAKTMFATHYHELTELTRIMKGVRNYHLSVQQWGDDIVFLYKAEEGSCDESFGIHVAKLAGMPAEVVKRAREILDNLQKDSFSGNICSRFSEDRKKHTEQFDFFTSGGKNDVVLEEIKKMDINMLTPMEALQKLSEIKNKIDGNNR